MKLRSVFSVLTLGLLLALPEASQAVPTLPPNALTTVQKTPFTSLVFVGNTTAPEWVLFAGEVDAATAVLAPTGACTPTVPCSVTGLIATATVNVTGKGLTSGLVYSLGGVGAFPGYLLPVPGATVVTTKSFVGLPKTIKPVGTLAVSVLLQTVITFDAGGNVLDAATPPLGIVSWWQGEGTAADAFKLNPGALSAGEVVSFAPGVSGQAFNFAGQGFVDVAPSATLQPANVTLAAWVKSAGSPGPFAYIASQGGSGCGFASYALYTGKNGGLEFYVSDGLNFTTSADAGAAVWDGAWHFVVGTLDAGKVRLYVDGTEIGTGVAAANPINYLYPNTRFSIGAFRGTCDLRFTGGIDEVQVYGRALSPIEVLALYMAGK